MQQWWRNCRQGGGDGRGNVNFFISEAQMKKEVVLKEGVGFQKNGNFATDDVFVWYRCIVNFQLETSEPQLSFGHVCLRVSR